MNDNVNRYGVSGGPAGAQGVFIGWPAHYVEAEGTVSDHIGDPFAVVSRPYSSEVEVIYEDLRFAPITAAYARTFAAALLSAADAAEQTLWLCRTCQKPCSADDPFCSPECRAVGVGVND